MTYYKEEYTLYNGQKIYAEYNEYNICQVSKECIEMLLDLYQQGRADAIDEFVKAIEKHQTRQDSYLDPPYVEMGLDMTDILEVAEKLKEQNKWHIRSLL